MGKLYITHKTPGVSRPPGNACKTFPWWDAELTEAKKSRLAALKAATKNKNPDTINTYRYHKNRVKNLILEKKSKYFQAKTTSISESGDDYQLWKLIQTGDGKVAKPKAKIKQTNK